MSAYCVHRWKNNPEGLPPGAKCVKCRKQIPFRATSNLAPGQEEPPPPAVSPDQPETLGLIELLEEELERGLWESEEDEC